MKEGRLSSEAGTINKKQLYNLTQNWIDLLKVKFSRLIHVKHFETVSIFTFSWSFVYPFSNSLARNILALPF